MVDAADDRFAIIATLDRYAECLDTRDWARLGQVFAGDAVMNYGMAAAQGVDEIRAGISSFLGGCGPSQHLLGNYRIELGGETARSKCYCRVMHMGKGEHEGKTYETWIEYRDELKKTDGQWLISHRQLHAQMEQGDRSLLGPE